MKIEYAYLEHNVHRFDIIARNADKPDAWWVYIEDIDSKSTAEFTAWALNNAPRSIAAGS